MKTRQRTAKDNRQAPNKVLEWLAAHNPISRLDRYIIGKFLGTYFFSIALIISIAVVFDFNENIDKFLSRNAPISAILFDYYLNFIPFFVNQFSGLITFIVLIFFTSRMAYNTEIVAMLRLSIIS